MQPKQDELSDVTLVLKDGKEIPVISNELSVASDFFSSLLGSDMRESREGIIRLEHITETCMRDVIDFMRYGDVSISQENAQDLFEAADYLLIPKLKTLAGRFLGQNIELSNCISTYYYAERYQITDLVASSRRLILSNFTTVAQSQEFLSLESHQVEQWIRSDDIVVSTEDEVFKILLGWIEQSKRERKEKFEELFRHVRLAFISRDYLRRDVVTNDLVKENSSCLELVKCAISATYCKSGDRPHPPRKWYETHLLVFTGKGTFCYQPDKDEWYRLGDAPYDDEHETVFKYQMKSFEGKVYVFMNWLWGWGGGATASAMYDPSLNHWIKIGGGCNKSAMSRVIVVGGEMYSVITKHKQPNSTTNFHNNDFYSYVSKYNYHSNYWNETFPLRAGNFAKFTGEACTVAMDNCLYVLGGCLITGCATPKAGRLDIVQKKWENIANMKIARYNACGVAAHRKIFIAGGITREGDKSPALVDRTATCEVYNPETNEWQLMASLNRPRSGGSMVCFKGTLYVLGWEQYIGRIDHASLRLPLTVESFDLKTKTWKQKTKIPLGKDLPTSFSSKSWINVQACVVNMYSP